MDEPLEQPIDGTLDLHTFQPRDVKELVPEYLEACRAAGVLQVRIIHGKGIGALRRTVHHTLDRTAGIDRYYLAPPQAGGWGATVVHLAASGESED